MKQRWITRLRAAELACDGTIYHDHREQTAILVVIGTVRGISQHGTATEAVKVLGTVLAIVVARERCVSIASTAADRLDSLIAAVGIKARDWQAHPATFPAIAEGARQHKCCH